MGASAIILMNVVISRTTYQTTKKFNKKQFTFATKELFAENSLVQAIIIVMRKKPQTI